MAVFPVLPGMKAARHRHDIHTDNGRVQNHLTQDLLQPRHIGTCGCQDRPVPQAARRRLSGSTVLTGFCASKAIAMDCIRYVTFFDKTRHNVLCSPPYYKTSSMAQTQHKVSARRQGKGWAAVSTPASSAVGRRLVRHDTLPPLRPCASQNP